MLEQRIENLSISQAADAIRNLRLVLGSLTSDADETQAISSLVLAHLESQENPFRDASNPSAELEWERWYKAVLVLAVREGFGAQVEEAIEDAELSSSKDMVTGAIGIFAVLLVLLKYRPTTFERSNKSLKITWRENDVGILSQLLRTMSGTPALLPGADQKP